MTEHKLRRMVWLIRGLPGTGKTSLAKVVAAGLGDVTTCILEANDYFVDPATQEFKFDTSKVKEAYDWCMDVATDNMRRGTQHIFVTNPFTKVSQMADYEQAARLYGYEVNVISCHQFLGNVHSVPVATLRKMRSQLDFPQTILPV